MKKILLLLLVVIVLISGCTGNSANQSDNTQSDTYQTSGATNAEMSGEVTVTNFDSIPLKTITAAKELNYQFSNPNGLGLDELAAFSHNKVLFTKGNDKEEQDVDGEVKSIIKPQIYLYDIATNDADYISKYNFINYGALDSLYMSDRYYIYATGSQTSDNNTVIYVTDTKDKTTSVLAELPGHFPTFSQYSENEFSYFYYYSQGDKYYQYVKLYNVETKETKVLLENITDASDSSEIYAADIHNDEIYVLYHKVMDDKLSTYINIYDIDGKFVKSIEDIDLGNKDKVEDEYVYATGLYVYDNTIFIKVTGMRGEYLFGFQYYGDTLSQFYGGDTGDINLYGKSGSSYAETPVSAVVDNNFLYLTAYSDNEKELMLFDLTTRKMFRFNFNINGFSKLVDVVVNEKGDVVSKLLYDEHKFDGATKTLAEPNVKYFYLTFEQIKTLSE